MHAIWKQYNIDELLLHSFLVLDWRDGYPEGEEEGTCLAPLGNYEVMFCSEYDSLNVLRLMPDGSKHYIYYAPVRLSFLADAIIDAKGFGAKFRLPYEGIEEAVIEELDKMQDVRLIKTPEGKYIRVEQETI